VSEITFLFSATYQQSAYWAREFGLKRDEWIHVGSSQDLMGRRGGKMRIVGTAHQRNDYFRILEEAERIGMEVVYG
jgi:hypothetical protein